MGLRGMINQLEKSHIFEILRLSATKNRTLRRSYHIVHRRMKQRIYRDIIERWEEHTIGKHEKREMQKQAYFFNRSSLLEKYLTIIKGYAEISKEKYKVAQKYREIYKTNLRGRVLREWKERCLKVRKLWELETLYLRKRKIYMKSEFFAYWNEVLAKYMEAECFATEYTQFKIFRAFRKHKTLTQEKETREHMLVNFALKTKLNLHFTMLLNYKKHKQEVRAKVFYSEGHLRLLKLSNVFNEWKSYINAKLYIQEQSTVAKHHYYKQSLYRHFARLYKFVQNRVQLKYFRELGKLKFKRRVFRVLSKMTKLMGGRRRKGEEIYYKNIMRLAQISISKWKLAYGNRQQLLKQARDYITQVKLKLLFVKLKNYNYSQKRGRQNWIIAQEFNTRSNKVTIFKCLIDLLAKGKLKIRRSAVVFYLRHLYQKHFDALVANREKQQKTREFYALTKIGVLRRIFTKWFIGFSKRRRINMSRIYLSKYKARKMFEGWNAVIQKNKRKNILNSYFRDQYLRKLLNRGFEGFKSNLRQLLYLKVQGQRLNTVHCASHMFKCLLLWNKHTHKRLEIKKQTENVIQFLSLNRKKDFISKLRYSTKTRNILYSIRETKLKKVISRGFRLWKSYSKKVVYKRDLSKIALNLFTRKLKEGSYMKLKKNHSLKKRNTEKMGAAFALRNHYLLKGILNKFKEFQKERRSNRELGNQLSVAHSRSVLKHYFNM